MLDSGARPDPVDPDTRDDVAHHYDATVKPALAGLDPARKAAAISGYVTETGITPETALDTLLALTATGDPANRIAAARELTSVLTADSAARGKVPPKIAEYSEAVVQLADLDALTPKDIITNAEGVFGEINTDLGGPSPALLNLATAKANDSAVIGGQPEFDDSFSGGDSEETAQLLDEFRTIRDGLADEGDSANTALVASIDDLVNAVERRDPAAIDRGVAELESRLSGIEEVSSEHARQGQVALLDGTESPEAVWRRIPDVGALWRLIERARKFLRNLGQGDRRQRQPNPDELNDDGVILPKPPSTPPKTDGPHKPDRGVGDNKPPSKLEEDDDRSTNIEEVELGPGVTVRADTTSRRWGIFKDALARLSGKSREAAEGLVNGGELKTIPGTHGSISNITRQGGLSEATKAYEEAITRAGGNPANVPAQTQPRAIVRTYRNPDDGTTFVHRLPTGQGDLTVEVQIVRRTPTGIPRRVKDHTIKIRFE